MSSNPWARTVPGDAMDESVNRNLKLVKPHPNRKGDSITLVALRQCKLCGWQFGLDVAKCPDCGSPSFRSFSENELIDIPTRGVTAHLRRKAEYCWFSKTDPVSEDVSRHRLVEQLVEVVDLNTGERHLQRECKTCSAVYGWSDGRTATEEEIELAKKGKIPGPTKNKALIMGAGNAP